MIEKSGNELHKWYGEWLALHRIPAGILHAWNHYTKLSMLFQVLGLWLHLNEIFFIGLGLTVTKINISK